LKQGTLDSLDGLPNYLRSTVQFFSQTKPVD